jgi:SAM-dependent methyltransferase
MPYVLENPHEFERLDAQSHLPAYDYIQELSKLTVESKSRVLDAGCGSGIVSHYLALQNPNIDVFGCDVSTERVAQAEQKYQNLPNLKFFCADLLHLDLNQKFDVIVCRYVLSHFNSIKGLKILENFKKHLNPRGKLYLVDVDGLFVNIFPKSPFLNRCLDKIEANEEVPVRMGRQLPNMVHKSGLICIQWNILTHCFNKMDIAREKEMIQARFLNASKYFIKTFGKKQSDRFMSEYLETLQKDGTALFYNMFIVQGEMPNSSNPVNIFKNGRGRK